MVLNDANQNSTAWIGAYEMHYVQTHLLIIYDV